MASTITPSPSAAATPKPVKLKKKTPKRKSADEEAGTPAKKTKTPKKGSTTPTTTVATDATAAAVPKTPKSGKKAKAKAKAKSPSENDNGSVASVGAASALGGGVVPMETLDAGGAPGLAGLAGLEARLQATSKYFNRCVNLIAPTHYFSKTFEQEAENASRFHVNKKEVAPKQLIKDASKKAKRARLDPTQHESTVDVQQARAAEAMQAKEVAAAAHAAGDAGSGGSDSDGDSDGEEGGAIDFDGALEPDADTDTTAGGGGGKKKKGGAVRRGGGGRKGGGGSLEEVDRSTLKERLASKLQELRGSRKDMPKSVNIKDKKRQAKLRAEKARTKIRMQHEADAANGSKAGPRKPLIEGATNSNGEVVFSKFDFSTAERVGVDTQKKKKGASTPMQLLAKAEADQAKLANLRESDPAAADEKEKAQKLKAALHKIDGGKVKSDPALLKRSIIRIESRKKKSGKLWNEREEHIKTSQKDKQAKRKANLKERSNAKLEKKMNRGKKVAKPKGKQAGKNSKAKKRPGFEGSKAKPSAK